MKVSELGDAELDYWVAKAEGWTIKSAAPYNGMVYSKPEAPDVWYWLDMFKPSRQWSQGGPLIAKYKIQVDAPRDYMIDDETWRADIDAGETNHFAKGNTPLQAICRCVVRAKFGDEIDGIRESAAHLSAQS